MTSPSVQYRSFRGAVVRWALLAALVPLRAVAEEQVELDWQAPPECPQRAAVQQKLRSLAGEAWRTTERVSAKGRIEKLERRYRLTLSVRDGATVKERTIESDSCVDLGGAAAVTLGLLLGRRKDARDAAQRDVDAHGYWVLRLRSSGRKLSSKILPQSGSVFSAPTIFCARIISFMAFRLISPALQ